MSRASGAGGGDIAPQLCTLRLRKQGREVAKLQEELDWAYQQADRAYAESVADVTRRQEELELYQALRAQCERAGDAEGARRYATKVEDASFVLKFAKASVSDDGDDWIRRSIREKREALDAVETPYNLLRDYTRKAHGQEWIDKARLSEQELSDAQLRAEASAWRRPEADAPSTE